MKALVVYSTKTGCTEGVAERIGKELAAHGVAVDVMAADKAPSPEAYDAVVVGSGIRAGQWHSSAKAWFSAHADALRELPVAMYTCCLTMADDAEKTEEVRAYTDSLLAGSGIEPIDIGLFAGWNEPKAFGFAERTILKVMKAPQGDFRDWDAIDEWTRGVAPRLSA